MQFHGSDYIEYVIKERFRRDYLLKDLMDDDTQEHIRNQTVINIKFKTKDDGVLFFVFGQTGYIKLMGSMTLILFLIDINSALSSKADKIS